MTTAPSSRKKRHAGLVPFVLALSLLGVPRPALAKKPCPALVPRRTTALVPYGFYRPAPTPRVVVHRAKEGNAPPVRDLVPPGRAIAIDARDPALLKVRSCITTAPENPEAKLINQIDINPRAIASRYKLGGDARLVGLYMRVPEAGHHRGYPVAVGSTRETRFSQNMTQLQRRDINGGKISVWATIETRSPGRAPRYTHVQQEVTPKDIADALSW
jgi:hypothetical protein